MASAVTITEVRDGRSVKKIKFAWTSHTDGVVTGVQTSYKYDGECIRFTTDPGDGGSAPDDNYDIVITDEDGYDVLAGGGLNRDTANNETQVAAALGSVSRSKLTFSASGCGSSKTGVAYLFIR